MRIRWQLRLTTLLFAALAAGVFLSAVITNQVIRHARELETRASDVSQAASDLVYLSTDYLMNPGALQARRWENRHDSVVRVVGSLHPESPQEQAIVQELQLNAQRLKDVFEEVRAVIHGSYKEDPRTYSGDFLRLSWSRLAVQSRGLILDALRLARVSRAGEEHLARIETFIVLGLTVTFTFYFLVAYLFLVRRTLASIQALQEGTAKVASGDLTYRIEERRHDEIGRLSREFNEMTRRLDGGLKEREAAERALREHRDNLERTVTERTKVLQERTAELEAANEELEAFAYAVSHDLRAPLRALHGFSSALLEDHGAELRGEAREFLDQITHASTKMGELIDGILDLSRSTRGELRREIVNLSSVAERILSQLQKEAPDRRLTWMVEQDLTADCDARLTEVVLNNLLGNSWKYTSRTPEATIRFSGESGHGERSFYVADNGAGFDMAYSSKLFQPFQRLHRQEEFPGIGIGLATVQRIIRRHGGTLRATGEPGRGASFCFSLSPSVSSRS